MKIPKSPKKRLRGGCCLDSIPYCQIDVPIECVKWGSFCSGFCTNTYRDEYQWRSLLNAGYRKPVTLKSVRKLQGNQGILAELARHSGMNPEILKYIILADAYNRINANDKQKRGPKIPFSEDCSTKSEDFSFLDYLNMLLHKTPKEKYFDKKWLQDLFNLYNTVAGNPDNKSHTDSKNSLNDDLKHQRHSDGNQKKVYLEDVVENVKRLRFLNPPTVRKSKKVKRSQDPLMPVLFHEPFKKSHPWSYINRHPNQYRVVFDPNFRIVKGGVEYYHPSLGRVPNRPPSITRFMEV